LADKKKVTIAGFGIWTSYEAKARNARNPRTGEALKVPAKQRVKFAALTHLKEWVETGIDNRPKAPKKKTDDDEKKE